MRHDVYDSNQALEVRRVVGKNDIDITVSSGDFLQQSSKTALYRPHDQPLLPNGS